MSDNHIVKPVDTSYEIESKQMHPLVKMAMRGGEVDTNTLRELMTLQKDWEKHEAKKAYTAAMVQLKAELPSTLERDRTVDFTSKQTGSKTNYTYTTLAHAMNAVSPHLTQFGFSLSWTPVTTDRMVGVTCRLTHIDGHFDEAKLSAAPDNTGAKNGVQAIGSTISYLQRYTALSLLGIATSDMKCVDELKSETSTIDASKNLDAVAYMHSKGIKVQEAEELVKRDLKSWTTDDLAIIKTWIKDGRDKGRMVPKEKPPAKELSARHKKIIESAKAVYGENYMNEISKLCRECTPPFSFIDASSDDLEYLEITIQNVADCTS